MKLILLSMGLVLSTMNFAQADQPREIGPQEPAKPLLAQMAYACKNQAGQTRRQVFQIGNDHPALYTDYGIEYDQLWEESNVELGFAKGAMGSTLWNEDEGHTQQFVIMAQANQNRDPVQRGFYFKEIMIPGFKTEVKDIDAATKTSLACTLSFVRFTRLTPVKK